MANQNIGHVVCPLTKKLAVVRADCRGKLYYFSESGKIAPNLPLGQQWLRLNAKIWSIAGVPDDNVSVREVVVGAPPIVELKKALTGQAEEKPIKKPLTLEPVVQIAANDSKAPQPKAANDGLWSFLESSGNE